MSDSLFQQKEKKIIFFLNLKLLFRCLLLNNLMFMINRLYTIATGVNL